MNQEEYLAHHGVKGMHWGISHDKTRSDVRAATRSAKTASKNRKVLPDEELDRRITRLEKERRLRTLTESEVSPGKKYASDILSNTGKVVIAGIIGASATGIGQAIWKKISAKF